jgi:hypothetical protein
MSDAIPLNRKETTSTTEEIMIKKTIISIACCALIAPLALAKEPKHKKHTMGYVEQRVTVTGTTTITMEPGAAAIYQPARTLVVNSNDPQDTNRYVVNGSGYVVDSRGEAIRTPIRPGSLVRVYFANAGGVKTIDHVVVVD